MIFVAFLTLVAAGSVVIWLSINRSYRLGFDKGYSEADALGKQLANQNVRARLALSVATAELERLRDELLSRDAGTYVRSI